MKTKLASWHPIFWTAISLTALFLIMRLIIGDNAQAHTRIWYLYGLTVYMSASLVVIVKTEKALLIQFLLGINIGGIVFLGGILIMNFLIELPLILKAACAWWVAFPLSSALLVLLILDLGVCYRRQQPKSNTPKPDLTLLN